MDNWLAGNRTGQTFSRSPRVSCGRKSLTMQSPWRRVELYAVIGAGLTCIGAALNRCSAVIRHRRFALPAIDALRRHALHLALPRYKAISGEIAARLFSKRDSVTRATPSCSAASVNASRVNAIVIADW